MSNKEIVSIEDFEKVVVDLLYYIEKETNIQFEYVNAYGSNELISIDSCNPNITAGINPAEVYHVDSFNYRLIFEIYVCEVGGRKKIIEIAFVSFSTSDEKFIEATKMITEILPNIPITHSFRHTVNDEEDDYEEDDYALY
jgi:hypothetical protein